MMFFGALFLALPCLAADYSVYCANGKIEIDMRTEAEMKSARGSNVQTLGKFNNRTDADKLAKQFGGVGGKCK